MTDATAQAESPKERSSAHKATFRRLSVSMPTNSPDDEAAPAPRLARAVVRSNAGAARVLTAASARMAAMLDR